MLTWISSLSREEQDEIKNHLYPNVDWDWDDDTYLEWGEQMITPADLPPKYRDLFYACVRMLYNMMNIGLSNLSPWII